MADSNKLSELEREEIRDRINAFTNEELEELMLNVPTVYIIGELERRMSYYEARLKEIREVLGCNV